VQDRFSLIAEPNLWDQAMAGADILVVPTCQHDLALVPLLAMGLGKVVIASRDQVADWFIEDETSVQFTPGSAVELAYHVARTAASHPNVLAVARGAAQYVRQNHAITRLAAELAGLYYTLRREVGDTATAKPRDAS
jgi:glycosyltransferase involved in cell wall biosynthesis